MKLLPFILWLQCFVTFVHAVHLDVAFKKDWVSYNHNLVNTIKLPSKHVLGQTSNNSVYNLDEDHNLSYFIDLKLHGHDTYEIVGPYIATYASSKTNIAFHRVSSGVFVDSIELNQLPISMKYSASGVFILLSDNELTLWNEKSLQPLGRYSDLHFNVFEFDNETIVASQNSYGRVANGKNIEPLDPGSEKKNDLSKVGELPPYLQLNTDFFCIFMRGIFVYKFEKQGPKLLSRLSLAGGLKMWKFSDDKLAISTLEGSVQLNPLFLIGKEDLKSQDKDLSISDKIAMIYKAADNIENEPQTMDPVDYYGVPEFRATDFEPVYLPVSYSASGKAVLVAKPASMSMLEKANHLEHDLQSSILLYRYMLRCKNHLVQLGKFVTNLWWNLPDDEILTNDVDYLGGTLLVYFDLSSNSLVAKEASNGRLLWVTDLPDSEKLLEYICKDSELTLIREKSIIVVSLRDGTVKSATALPNLGESILKYSDKDGSDSFVRLDEECTGNTTFEPTYSWKQHGDILQGYRIQDSQLVSTWEFSDDGKHLVAVSKNSDKVLKAAGIARSDKSVLYKYLNPNLLAVLSTQGEGLRLSLLDGVLGRLLHRTAVTEEKIEPESVKVVVSNNWIVVTYFVHGSSLEQRITVYDLFTDSKMAQRGQVSSFENMSFNVSVKSFVFPERIAALAATETKFGITTKSILVFTSNGNLIEVPKYILNSRRIDDRKMSQADYMDDFRMSPYEPLIRKDAMKVINHKIKLKSDGIDQILVKATELESTATVCLVNTLNEFCSIVQPSLSYDTLPEAFRKTSLLVTIITLFVIHIAIKPLVYSKKLNEKWVE